MSITDMILAAIVVVLGALRDLPAAAAQARCGPTARRPTAPARWRPRWASLGFMALLEPARPVPGDPLLTSSASRRSPGPCSTVTSRNPVYSALWFASVVLSTSGLFLLADAPFLAAGTIIVYAGAIIVTFLFVIMLAQMEGKAHYDRAARARRRRRSPVSCSSGA